MTASAVTLSIVIVSYNTRADLERCLESIEAHRATVPCEVVVVDNGSTDGSVDFLRQRGNILSLEVGVNVGFSVATNRGIRASAGEYLLLLNSDTIVPPAALDGLVVALRAHPEVAAVGPRLVDGHGRAELSFGRMLSPFVEVGRRRIMRGLARHDPRTVARVEAMTRREQYPDWVSGACLLVRRADAFAAGLLDERFFMYTEDVDFCAALRARGRRILFTPSVQVTHLRGRSAASAPASTRAAYRRSHLAFYEKHHPSLTRLLRACRAVNDWRVQFRSRRG